MSRLNDQFGRGLASVDPAGDAGFKVAARAATGIGCIAVVYALGFGALFGGTIYVIMHFLAKVW